MWQEKREIRGNVSYFFKDIVNSYNYMSIHTYVKCIRQKEDCATKFISKMYSKEDEKCTATFKVVAYWCGFGLYSSSSCSLEEIS